MQKRNILSILLLIGICALFFYPMIMKRYMPFPGDLLMHENPYKADSFLGYAPGGYPSKGQDRDVLRELAPWKYFSISEMKEGRLPLWNPYNFSGSILLQNFQSAVFYPINVIFFILPFISGWNVFILSQPVLAAIFMFLFLRELQRSYMASILGAVGFAFSSYMIVWIEYGNIDATFLWLPLMLLFLYRFIKNQSITSAIGFVFASTIALLAGYIQGFFYMMVICTIFVLWMSERKTYWTTVLKSIPLFLLPVGFGAVQLLLTYGVFSVSTRGAYTTSQIEFLLNPLYLLATLVAPDYFGNPATQTSFLPFTYIERVMYPGMVILILSLYTLFVKKDSIEKMFLWVAGIVLVLTLQIPGIAYFYKLPIPMISTSVPTRMLSVFLFSLCILAAYGVDTFVHMKTFPKRFIVLLLVTLLTLWGSALLASHTSVAEHAQVLRKAMILPTLLLVATLIGLFVMRKFEKLGKIFLLCMLVGDLFFFFQKITPFAPSQFFYPSTDIFSYLKTHQGLDRFWGYGDGYITPNLETREGMYAPEGEDPLHNKWYGMLLASSEKGMLGEVVPRPDANIAPGYGPSDLTQNVYRKRLLDMLGVKYLLARTDAQSADTSTFPENQYQLVYKNTHWQVYENKDVLPRVFLTSDYHVEAQDARAIYDFYHDTNAKDLVLSTAPELTPDRNATGTARIVSYTPQKVVIDASGSANTLLFLSDSYYPDWEARVDGKTTPIIRANVALRAIALPTGTHTIIFSYNLTPVKKGMYIMGITFLLGLGYLWVISKKRRRVK